MTLHHHLSDSTLGAFTAGTLIESLALVVASHLSLCAACRKQRDQLETIGGVQLAQAQPVKISADALNQIMVKLDKLKVPSLNRPTNDPSSNEIFDQHIPTPLRAYVPGQLEDVEWKTMAPGIKCHALADLKTGNGTMSLLKIAPGITIPEHGHQGSELTLVLKGSFSDEIGRFTAGDIADLDESTEHQPISDSSEACICLIATEAPLKFTKLMPRLVQYFVGM